MNQLPLKGMCCEDFVLSMTLPYPILDIIGQDELFESYLYKFIIGSKHYSGELLVNCYS